MLRLAAAATLAVALLACQASAAAAAPRALVAFLPTEEQTIDRPGMPLLDRFARRGLAVGLTSPTLGGYSDRQMALDVSQGARVATRAYDRPAVPYDLVPGGDGGGRMSRWHSVVERARRAPGDVVPGLLSQSLTDAGRTVAFAGVAGEPHYQAVVAARRDGRVARAGLYREAQFAASATALWRDADLLVARLPRDAAGLAALDRLLAARRPGDLVYVVRSPPIGRLRLLPTGVAGLDEAPGGLLTSATTRRRALAAATDVAPTVLARLGVAVPAAMQGRALRTASGGGPREARAVADRLGVVVARRAPAVAWFVAAWLVLGVALAARERAAGARRALRLGFLGALWAPGVLLVTAALAPPRLVEMAGLALGSLALAALTDGLVRWPFAPAVPAAAVFVAYALDLAAGSPLTAASLAGPNPMGGARYYGVGNELETILSLSVLLGAGAGLSAVRRKWAPWGFAIACLVAAAVLGAGRLGADVGAVITLGAGGAAAVLVARERPLSARTLATVVAVPLVAVAALVALDTVTGADAHLSRSVIEAGGAGELLDLAERRLRLSLSGLSSASARVNTVVALAVIALGLFKRRELLAPLATPFRAGVLGALAATLVGALANDSGPLMLLLGTVALVLATGYAQAGRYPSRGRG